MEIVLNHLKKAVLALACAATLVACGGGNSDPNEKEHHEHIDTSGRLVVTEVNSEQVHVLDLDEGRVIQSYAADYSPSAIHASPGWRYALLMHGGGIQLMDGGIYQESHNDHIVGRKKAPALLPVRLTGGVSPRHYSVHNGLASIFFEGANANIQGTASVTVLSEKSIGDMVPALASLPLTSSMLGRAEPRGDWLLTTWRAADAERTLPRPSHVELYERHGDRFRHVQRLTPECPNLLSSYSNANYTVFGCSDGVLVVEQSGSDFTARKISNPPELSEGTSIANIIGNQHMGSFVGWSGTFMYEINPMANTITRIMWADNNNARSRAVALDRNGENLLALDDVGTLHILSTSGWHKRAQLVGLIAKMPYRSFGAGWPDPVIAVSAQDDKAWVSDPIGRLLHPVDIGDAKPRDPIALNFYPHDMAWVGIAEY